MENEQIQKIAETLHNARLEARSVGQFSSAIKDFTRNDAYGIQECGIKLRQKSGEKIIGLKMGLTSEGKRKQMNLDSPLYGILTDKMEIKNEGIYHLQGSIHPKIEPEIAFFINQELSGHVTREKVLSAIGSVFGALEILDSRYTGFKYFSMEDVISDNSSSSHYVLGPKLEDFKHLDLKNLKMEMFINNESVALGNSGDISGDPVVSIIHLVELLHQRNQVLPAGMFVLAGAATNAVDLKSDMKVSLKVDGLPDLSLQTRK